MRERSRLSSSFPPSPHLAPPWLQAYSEPVNRAPVSEASSSSTGMLAHSPSWEMDFLISRVNLADRVARSPPGLHRVPTQRALPPRQLHWYMQGKPSSILASVQDSVHSACLARSCRLSGVGQACLHSVGDRGWLSSVGRLVDGDMPPTSLAPSPTAQWSAAAGSSASRPRPPTDSG